MLVINDNPEFLDLLREVLTDEGYSVQATPGEQLTVDDIVRARPDLVIIDLVLHGNQLRGWEFIALARSDDRLEDVPILVCSGDLQALEHRAQELQQRALTYVLPKPFALEELEAMVSRALARDAAPPPPA